MSDNNAPISVMIARAIASQVGYIKGESSLEHRNNSVAELYDYITQNMRGNDVDAFIEMIQERLESNKSFMDKQRKLHGDLVSVDSIINGFAEALRR